MTTVNSGAPRSGAQDLLRDYHDARRREDQWRIPQFLTALVTPVMALISVMFVMAGDDGLATAAGGLAVVTGTAAALLTAEVWRWHRTAVSHVNRFRTEYAADHALLMNDPI